MTEPRPSYRSLWLPDLLWLVALVFLATVPFLSGNIDLRLQSLFHTPAAATAWSYESHPLWKLLYHIGTWPALLIALGGLLVFLLGRRLPSLGRWRRHGIYLFLVLAIGPGLLVNTIFKDHWGRPRPRQIAEFGGRWHYQHPFENGAAGRGKSFPCGHSSAGYYFIAFYFLFRRHRRGIARMAFAAAMLYGSLIGTARMAAGAHFASDVLWSGVFTAAAALVLYYWILRIPWHEDHPAATTSGQHPVLVSCAAALLAAGAILAVIAATPVFKEWHLQGRLPPNAATSLELRVARCDVELTLTDTPDRRFEITGEAQGFGWPWCRIREKFTIPSLTSNVVHLTISPDRGFNDLSGTVRVKLPARLLKEIAADMEANQFAVLAPAGLRTPPMTIRLTGSNLDLPSALKAALVAGPPTNGTQTFSLPALP